MSLGFLIVMLLCVGISFSLAVIDPAAVHLLSWAGAAYIVWLAWKIATSPTKEDGLQAKPISFWASFALQFVNVKIIFVWRYGTVDVCPAANAGAKLGSWRQRFCWR
ncbi:putative transporter [Escherichia coli]|uniref:Putative transporter n=1 Tax=Escherichia coli TaxID=562 RepID=A0A376J039_ECOLX|nr:putative transporter [Escherichia coli]